MKVQGAALVLMLPLVDGAGGLSMGRRVLAVAGEGPLALAVLV